MMPFLHSLPYSAAPIPVGAIMGAGISLFKRPEATARLRDGIARHFGTRRCFLFSSGTAALCTLLQAMRRLRPDRTEVLAPAFTCYTVAAAVMRAGLTLRLCDINPLTLDLDHDALRGELQDNRSLLCVIPTHLFGLRASVEQVRTRIKKRGVWVVEDAAQAMGTVGAAGRPVGTLGDASFFSLGRSKALSTVHGGVLLVTDAQCAAAVGKITGELPDYPLLDRLSILGESIALSLLQHPRLFRLPQVISGRQSRITPMNHRFFLGRMSAVQAALARGWQRRLERAGEIRRRNCARWAAAFEGTDLHGYLPGDAPLPLVRFPVLLPRPSAARQAITEGARRGFGISVTYEQLKNIPALRRDYLKKNYPGASAAARRLVALPTHTYVRARDIETIAEFLKGL